MEINKIVGLNELINAAKSGDASALEELSLIALGGNKSARIAIKEIDGREWQPIVSKLVPAMIWPNDTPKLGDVPIHNEV